MAVLRTPEASKRRPRRWRVEYYTPQGAHRSRTFRTRREAELFLHRVEAAKHERTYRDPSLGRRPLGEVAEAYLAGAYELRLATRALYEGAWRRYVAPRFAEVPVASIRADDVRAWVGGLLRAGVGPRTVQVARQVLGRVLERALEDGLVRENPVRRVRPPKAPPKEARVPTTAELEAVAEAIDPRYRAMVLVAAYAGLRFGECAGLERRDVDLLARKLHVRRQVTEVQGRLEVGEPKTATSRRTVPLPSFLAGELAAHLERYVAPGPEAQVFTAPGAGLLGRTAWRSRYFEPALRRAGVERFTFHGLRDHAATAAISAGADVKVVQAILGHTDATVTLNRYAAAWPSAAEAVAERLSSFRRKILRWFRENGRAFPWRRRCDRYAVLIGEILLQRTRGEAVAEVFEAFLRRWPSPDRLAVARPVAVAAVIRPLGLMKRAPLLVRLGRELSRRGDVPIEPEDLLTLPGVGPYAAHAVPVFADGRSLPVVDWVIARVLRRYFGLPSDRRPNADPDLWRLAEDLARPGKARELWLGTLDLASAVCRPKPLCSVCPLRGECGYATLRAIPG